MSIAHKKKLIDLVEAYPDLWKITRKAPSLKQRLWNSVGAELSISGYDARRQWEILRDQFRREHKRLANDKNYKSKWIFYNRMLFVRHVLRPKDKLVSPTHFDQEDQDSDDQRAQTYATRLPEDSKNNVRQDLQGGHSYIGMDTEASASAGVTSSCPRHCEEGNFTRRRRHRESEDSEDEDYHFVMSILPSLRSLHRSRKLRVRSKIMELIATELDADVETQQRGPAETDVTFKSEESC